MYIPRFDKLPWVLTLSVIAIAALILSIASCKSAKASEPKLPQCIRVMESDWSSINECNVSNFVICYTVNYGEGRGISCVPKPQF